MDADAKRCGIPSHNVGVCDLDWGHDGDMHANGGDGFYARAHEEAHRSAQKARAALEAHQQVANRILALARDPDDTVLDIVGRLQSENDELSEHYQKALAELSAKPITGAETTLRNLLARIHRDGGHYTEEHGIAKSAEDAEQVVLELRVEISNCREKTRQLAGRLLDSRTVTPEKERSRLARAVGEADQRMRRLKRSEPDIDAPNWRYNAWSDECDRLVLDLDAKRVAFDRGSK